MTTFQAWLFLCTLSVATLSCKKNSDKTPAQESPQLQKEEAPKPSAPQPVITPIAIPSPTPTHTPTAELFVKFDDETQKSFALHPALDRGQDLILPLKVGTQPDCIAKVYCKYAANIWSLCPIKDQNLIISKEEIISGYQTIEIRQQCGSQVSPQQSLNFFGVKKDYEPLALEGRPISKLLHLRLQRNSDCTGKLSYECKAQGSDSFNSCSNVLVNPDKGLQIRASCASSDGIKLGPIFKLLD